MEWIKATAVKFRSFTVEFEDEISTFSRDFYFEFPKNESLRVKQPKTFKRNNEYIVVFKLTHRPTRHFIICKFDSKEKTEDSEKVVFDFKVFNIDVRVTTDIKRAKFALVRNFKLEDIDKINWEEGITVINRPIDFLLPNPTICFRRPYYFNFNYPKDFRIYIDHHRSFRQIGYDGAKMHIFKIKISYKNRDYFIIYSEDYADYSSGRIFFNIKLEDVALRMEGFHRKESGKISVVDRETLEEYLNEEYKTYNLEELKVIAYFR